MKARILGKIAIAMVLMLVMLSFSNTARALTLSDMESKANDFINAGADTSIDYKKVTEEFVGLGQILTMIGVGVMVAVTTYMGIKYLTAGPEAQAKLKVQLIGLVVSGVVIFGAYSIWSIVLRIAAKF